MKHLPRRRTPLSASLAVLLTAAAISSSASPGETAPSMPAAPGTPALEARALAPAAQEAPSDPAQHHHVVSVFSPAAQVVADPDAGATVLVADDDGARPNRPWTFAGTLILWGAGIDGDVEASGADADADEGPFDALADAELGFVFRGEARHDDQGGWIEFYGQQIEDEHSHTPGGASADVEVEQAYLEAAYAHELADDPTLDLYAGLRRWHVDTTVDLDGGPDFSQDESWVDPFVGVRKRWALDEHWDLAARADVGGFDLGDASDFAFNAQAQAERRLDDHTTWLIGYRLLGIDYDKGSSFDHDVVTHGLLTGVTVRF